MLQLSSQIIVKLVFGGVGWEARSDEGEGCSRMSGKVRASTPAYRVYRPMRARDPCVTHGGHVGVAARRGRQRRCCRPAILRSPRVVTGPSGAGNRDIPGPGHHPLPWWSTTSVSPERLGRLVPVGTIADEPGKCEHLLQLFPAWSQASHPVRPPVGQDGASGDRCQLFVPPPAVDPGPSIGSIQVAKFHDQNVDIRHRIHHVQ